MEHNKSTNTIEVQSITNEKLQLLQDRLARIAAGDATAAEGLTPHDVGVEGMYNVAQALRRHGGRTTNEPKLHV